MVTMSSLVATVPGPKTSWLTQSMVCSGLIRPGITPVCTPSCCNGSASGMRRPVRTVAAASLTTPSVIRLRVPISSSCPQRPQLFTRLAMSWNAAGSAMGRLLETV
jgi:hypothetical protein